MEDVELDNMGEGIVVYNSQGYPKREGVETCSFFVENGQCKFGTSCKWNHPEFIYPGVDFNSGGFPLRPDATDCEFYAKMRECKYGCTCKFNHPEPDVPQDNHMPATGVNSMGYPRRAGAQQCAFFMKNGSCKYAATCKFDHPEKLGMGGMMHGGGMMQMHQGMQMQQVITYNSKGYPVRPGTAMCQFYVRTGECKFGPTCKWDHSEGGMMNGGGGGMQMHTRSTRSGSGAMNSLGLPLRPGSQTCQFFSKNGSCSYGNKCKWDHPEEYCQMGGGGGTPKPSPKHKKSVGGELNSLGFPLRPGQGPCAFYMQKGTCSYGGSCKWDHPEGMGGTQPGFQKSANQMTSMRSTPY